MNRAHELAVTSSAAPHAIFPSALVGLTWYRITADLYCERAVRDLKQGVLLGAIENFIKIAGRSSPSVQVVFRLLQREWEQLIPRAGATYRLELRLFGSRAAADAWRAAFSAHFDSSLAENYALGTLGALELRRTQSLVSPRQAGEVVLAFHSPYAFHAKNSPRTRLTLDKLLADIARRIERLFGVQVGAELAQAAQGVILLPWYWRYVESSRGAKSQAGATQYLNGCIGPLFLQGDLGPLMPWLAMAEELQLGSKPAFGLGHFSLSTARLAYFDRALSDEAALHVAVQEALERYDDMAEALALGGVQDEGGLAASLLPTLRGEAPHIPEPHHAFRLPKPDGSHRQLERLVPRELALHLHLHRVLAPVLDSMFEDASVGYRKGYSRDTATERIRKAIGEGYAFVVEADIGDFFPSIDLCRLLALLDGCLPQGDTVLRELLRACLHSPCHLRGEVLLRENGLAQGSPLSPLLANLYLDAFDEALLAQGAQLVRYADDFVIFARTLHDAEALLGFAGDTLAALGLQLRADKTAIHPVDCGFRFLGVDFGPYSAPPAGDMPLKKPLYITQPGRFLGATGDALDVRHQGQLVETLPFHRISEIIVMGYASFSSGVIKKCSEFRVPLTVCQSSGYHVATFTPDSRQYHDVAYRQAVKFESMNDNDRLAIAREFARGKLAAYRQFHRQRYRRGDSRKLLAQLDALASDMNTVADVAALRGKEGSAARLCFAALNHYLRDPVFHIRRRERKQPDAINSLLNFGYYLLFTRINVTLRALGLNPYLGFLHASADRYESLACDVQELYRARIDRLIVRLLNLKAITVADFVDTERGQRLTREASQRFVQQFERELAAPPRNLGLALGAAIHATCVSLREYFTRNRALQFYVPGGNE